MDFVLKSDYQPTGDQPKAIEELTKRVSKGVDQVLLGVTGSGKTFTMANVIANTQKPTLVIAHNKTLAAQLYQEFRDFFPDNAVSYFVSYYDFYQPEAYIPRTDTYIEKETEINEEIDKLRLSATTNLLTRKDVIVVASVSCIYGLGSPAEYGKFILELAVGESGPRRGILSRLTELQYERNEYDFQRGSFRVGGENLDIFPSYEDFGVRVSFLEDKIQKISTVDPLTGKTINNLDKFVLYPAKHYMTDPATYVEVFEKIRSDTSERVKDFRNHGKLIEAQRLSQRVEYDLEMIAEIGYVNGIENYSRYFDGRKEGEPPYTLLDYFPKDYLLVIDESHMTVPQIRGMYNGDHSRKQTLIDYGFRLPAALDNRPLRFDEFLRRKGVTVYTSATPDSWERDQAQGRVVEQLIRPTGIPDPEVSIRPSKGQIDDLIKEIRKKKEVNQRVLVTTLTKRTAEELTEFLSEKVPEVKVAYLHSDIETLERSEILRKLRLGEYDVLIGINLLREGLDLPEVGLVAILDSDKEGFLRSEVSLIQTMGRAARNIDSKVVMYADSTTSSMERAVAEVKRRREIQLEWNEKHGVLPKTVVKPVRENIVKSSGRKKDTWRTGSRFGVLFDEELGAIDPAQLLPDQKRSLRKVVERRMKEAARILDFEGAAFYRDFLKKLD